MHVFKLSALLQYVLPGSTVSHFCNPYLRQGLYTSLKENTHHSESGYFSEREEIRFEASSVILNVLIHFPLSDFCQSPAIIPKSNNWSKFLDIVALLIFPSKSCTSLLKYIGSFLWLHL